MSSACFAADDVRPQKYAYAVRAEAAPTVDGKLDDAVWKAAAWNGEYFAAKTGSKWRAASASGDSLAREYDFWEDAGRLGWKFYTTVLKQNVKNVAGRIEMASARRAVRAVEATCKAGTARPLAGGDGGGRGGSGLVVVRYRAKPRGQVLIIR